MKKILIIILALAMVCSAAFLGSCGKDNSNEKGGTSKENSGTSKENNTAALVTIDDLAEFTIVRSDKASGDEKAVAVSLRKTIDEKFGVSLNIGTDYSGKNKKEIIIGDTKRAETKQAKEDITSYSEYLIRRVGDKIIICAGSVEALGTAVEFWTTKMVNKSGKLCIPNDKNGYIYSPETKIIDDLTIDGEPIENFVIVNTASEFVDIAESIGETIFELADTKLQIFTDPEATLPAGAHVIRIGDLGSDVKMSSFEVKNGNIEITPSYYDFDWSVNYIEMLFDGAVDRRVDITSNHNTEAIYESDEIYTKEDVMSVLEKVYNSEQMIVGTEMTNSANVVTETLENYYEKSGQYPGILGLDVRLSNLHKLGKAGIEKVVADLTKYAESGGIITASAHFSNPAENGGDPTIENYRGTIGGDDAWAQLITEGTPFNTSFKQELEGIADFFEDLKENGVPVIWRPLHETNGNWFWFAMVQSGVKIREESFANLWIYIHDYFTIERGLDNLLWEFSPNIDNGSEVLTEPLYGFPGKDYVDLVGFDWYTRTGDPMQIETARTYKDLASLGMVINLNEFGPAGDFVADEEGEIQEDIFSCESILGMFKEMDRIGDYKFGYLLTWTDNLSIPELGKSKEFMDHEMTLGLVEVKAMFDELK